MSFTGLEYLPNATITQSGDTFEIAIDKTTIGPKTVGDYNITVIMDDGSSQTSV